MKKFILFDNDGVLVETEVWYYEANVKALKELGLSLDFEKYMEIMSRGGTAWELAFENGVDKNTVDKKRFQRDIYYQEFLQSKNIEIKGVKKLLEKLSKDFKMAIITTSRRVDFDLIHKNRGIVDFMDFSLCVEEYPRAKPHPDPYLAGIERFGAKKEESIVIEDSKRGLDSAISAGIECAVVKNEFTKTQDFSKATYYIEKLEELEHLLKRA